MSEVNVKLAVGSMIDVTNEHLNTIRKDLFTSLELMIENGTHEFDKNTRPYITDEEECVRLGAKSCTKDIVTLSDGSEMDLGEVGTDDLLSIVDQVHSDLYDK